MIPNSIHHPESGTKGLLPKRQELLAVDFLIKEDCQKESDCSGVGSSSV
jgi:hypothetical protein